MKISTISTRYIFFVKQKQKYLRNLRQVYQFNLNLITLPVLQIRKDTKIK